MNAFIDRGPEMRCSWVQERLVAFADDELSPGEAAFVHEHLEGCEACAALDAGLREVTPAPALAIPPEVMARMAIAVDEAVRSALDEPAIESPPPLTTRWGRWLRRDRDLSNGAMLAYGMLLAACVGWGLSNWIAYQELQREVTDTRPVATVAPANPATIDSEAYEPASYSPGAAEDNWR